MSDPISRVATRVAYGASQLPRIAWYLGHSLAVRRLSKAAQRDETARKRGKRPHQFARAGPQTPLRRYGYSSPAGPRQYLGRPLPVARRS
jgi:hypothetical protein